MLSIILARDNRRSDQSGISSDKRRIPPRIPRQSNGIASRREFLKSISTPTINDRTALAKYPRPMSIITGGFLNMIALSALNARYGIPSQLTFKEGPGGMTVGEVTSMHAAAVALQGAQVMLWTPQGQSPVICSRLPPGSRPASRCAAARRYAGRGSARTRPIRACPRMASPAPCRGRLPKRALADGAIELALALVESEQTRAQWPHRARLSLRISVGRTLKLTLTTVNTGDHDFCHRRGAAQLFRYRRYPHHGPGRRRIPREGRRGQRTAASGRAGEPLRPRPTGFI